MFLNRIQRVIWAVNRLFLFFRYSLNGLKNPGYTRIFAVSLYDSPRMNPDQTNLRLNPSWKGSKDACDGETI